MKRPAIFLSICYIAGVLTKLYVNQFMAMIGIIATLIILYDRINAKYWRRMIIFIFLFFFGYLNMTRVIHYINPMDDSDVKQSYEVVGVVTEIDQDKNKIVCKDSHIKTLVYCQSVGLIQVGDRVKAQGMMKGFLGPTNPGGFNAPNYYYAQGIYDSLYCKNVEIIHKPNFSLLRFFHHIKVKLERQLFRVLPEQEASILSTMLLGTHLDQDIKAIYQLAGISHLLAISGLHITIIGMGFFHIIKKVIKNLKIAICLSIFLLINYNILTGCSASTIRASIMLGLMLLTIFFKESYDSISALFLSALGMLIINPYQILDIGFLLSFSAVGGILWLTPLLNQRYNPNKSTILKGLFVSLGATLTTLPIVSWYFFVIPLYALLVNLLVVPVTSIIIGMTILAISLSFLNTTFSHLIGGTVFYSLKFIESCCLIVSRLPLHSIPIGKMSFFEVILFYMFLYILTAEHIPKMFSMRAFICFRHYFSRLSFCRSCWLNIKGLCILILCIYLIFKNILPYNQMKIIFLDVGQGDGTVIEYRSKVFLIDGGGEVKTSKSKSNDKNTGTYVVLPYLASQGINHINGIFISHSDFDHIYGIIEVIQEIKTDFIVLSNVYEHTPSDSLIQELKEIANQKGIKLVYFSEGDHYIYHDLNIYCLYPYDTSAYNLNNNGNSLVLRLDFKQFNVLFTGDIEIEQEHSLTNNKQTFIEVMKVPHHGSETSSSEIFLEKFLPDIAVFSYGKSNKFGHPSVSVVKRYQNLAVIDYHIAREGAVIIKTNGQNYTVHTYSSHRKDKYICNN